MTTPPGIKSTRIELDRASAGETNKAYIELTDGTDSFKVFSNSGNPETVITANEGSLCIDTTANAGKLYGKLITNGNAGWESFGMMTGPNNVNWVPTVKGNVTAGSAVYSVQTGTFTSFTNGIVRMYVASAQVAWTGHTSAGENWRNTLPAFDGGSPPAITSNITTNGVTWPVGITHLVGIPVGSAQWDLAGSGSGVASAPVVLPAAGNINYTIIYFTA